MIDLLTRHPQLSPQQLIEHLSVGSRFAKVRFDNYQPNAQYPSQQSAHSALLQFVAEIGQSAERRGLLRRRKAVTGRGIYLDGGFGVGKTHLLSAAFFDANERGYRVAIMSFQELMYLIGALGMTRAVQTFRQHHLLLIDEFELDDPGNTHMANTFLGQLMPTGTHVIATSNTEAGALGEGRFSAEDFQRQIQAIAGRFVQYRLDGPDYRQRSHKPAEPFSDHEYTEWILQQDQASTAVISHRELNRHLLVVHPSQFTALLEDVNALAVEHLTAMSEQAVALRFVHFVDKLYDSGIRAAFTGVPLISLFSDTYRHGAYAKKYGRCLSRLSEMLSEVRADMQPPHPN